LIFISSSLFRSILSCLLLETPKSPLFKKIIEAGLAPSFSYPIGFDSSIKEGTFTIGVQNIP
jgi:Zn-dependent M16 (insulinase) family peptidase